jgi:hypothetical protein
MKKLFGALLCAVLAAAFLLRSNAVALNMFAGLYLPGFSCFRRCSRSWRSQVLSLAGYGKIISFPFRPITLAVCACRMKWDIRSVVASLDRADFPPARVRCPARVARDRCRRQDARRMLALRCQSRPALCCRGCGKKFSAARR